MEIFTWDEHVEQCEASLQEVSYNTNGFDFSKKSHSQWSHGEYREVQLQPGLWLEIDDEVFHRSKGVKGEHDEDFRDVISKFYLSGNHLVTSPPGIVGVQENYAEQGGQNYLFHLPDMWEIEQGFAGDRMQLVKVSMEPDFVRTFCSGSDMVPLQLRPLFESNSAPRFHRPVGSITPTMRVVLQQILQAPYQGMVQRMYLEGKALELVALQLAQLIESEQGRQSFRDLKPAEIEQIYQAKEILIRNWLEPPSLIELVRQVGLNECTLKRGFQQVFGTTAFGCLHNYRMEQARQLLETSTYTVKEVAQIAGYRNRSAFSRAFHKHFGISARDWMKRGSLTLWT